MFDVQVLLAGERIDRTNIQQLNYFALLLNEAFYTYCTLHLIPQARNRFQDSLVSLMINSSTVILVFPNNLDQVSFRPLFVLLVVHKSITLVPIPKQEYMQIDVIATQTPQPPESNARCPVAEVMYNDMS